MSPVFSHEKGKLERKKIRVLIAIAGLDSHSRGAMVVAEALRDAGMEVIYTGLHQSPEKIVKSAIQESVDVIGVSAHSGAQLTIMPKIMNLLRENKTDNIPVILGGVVPKEDIRALKEIGVREVFGLGTDTRKIVQFIKDITT